MNSAAEITLSEARGVKTLRGGAYREGKFATKKENLNKERTRIQQMKSKKKLESK